VAQQQEAGEREQQHRQQPGADQRRARRRVDQPELATDRGGSDDERQRRRLRQAGWIGEAGPGPSYLDAGSGGPQNDFTNRNTTFMTWNLLHAARMLKDAGGVPAFGNQRPQWDAGTRFDLANPEHRA
jgi:hypothetical protein